MDKTKLIQTRKKIIAIGLLGVMLGTTGCSNKDNNQVPKRVSISSEYYDLDKYITYAVKGGKAVKLYKSETIYLLYDKETYAVNEYIFANKFTLFEEKYGGELYDLETEEMLCYSDGIATSYNKDYFKYLTNSNYVISLVNLENYVEGAKVKDYYTLEEIKELESIILKGLKLIVEENNKILIKKK